MECLSLAVKQWVFKRRCLEGSLVHCLLGQQKLNVERFAE